MANSCDPQETEYYCKEGKNGDYLFKDTTPFTDVLGDGDFNKALHDGIFVAGSNAVEEMVETVVATVGIQEEASASVDITSAIRNLASATSGGGMELTLYSKIGMGDGQQAGNPWLQEFPDPISRVSWDNYVTVSKADAKNLGLINE